MELLYYIQILNLNYFVKILFKNKLLNNIYG